MLILGTVWLNNDEKIPAELEPSARTTTKSYSPSGSKYPVRLEQPTWTRNNLIKIKRLGGNIQEKRI